MGGKSFYIITYIISYHCLLTVSFLLISDILSAYRFITVNILFITCIVSHRCLLAFSSLLILYIVSAYYLGHI